METIDAISELWAKAINDNRYPVAVSMNEMVYWGLCGEAYLESRARDMVGTPTRIRNMDVLIHGDEADPTIRILWKPHREEQTSRCVE